MSIHTALLILDAQVNMFAEDGSVYQGKELLQRINQLISRARAAHIPVIYVQNNGGEGDPDIPGTPGWQIHPAITPAAGDIVIQKHTPDAFHETSLQGELESRSIHKLVIAGMQTELCIDATCRQAVALGYDVTLVKDAHSTFDSKNLAAAQIIVHHNDALSSVAKVEEANNITFE